MYTRYTWLSTKLQIILFLLISGVSCNLAGVDSPFLGPHFLGYSPGGYSSSGPIRARSHVIGCHGRSSQRCSNCTPAPGVQRCPSCHDCHSAPGAKTCHYCGAKLSVSTQTTGVKNKRMKFERGSIGSVLEWDARFDRIGSTLKDIDTVSLCFSDLGDGVAFGTLAGLSGAVISGLRTSGLPDQVRSVRAAQSGILLGCATGILGGLATHLIVRAVESNRQQSLANNTYEQSLALCTKISKSKILLKDFFALERGLWQARVDMPAVVRWAGRKEKSELWNKSKELIKSIDRALLAQTKMQISDILESTFFKSLKESYDAMVTNGVQESKTLYPMSELRTKLRQTICDMSDLADFCIDESKELLDKVKEDAQRSELAEEYQELFMIIKREFSFDLFNDREKKLLESEEYKKEERCKGKVQ